MPCLVCGAPRAESHFGGISCRACAAFFRRFFTSKKVVIGCDCKTKNVNSHPCRSCRVAKCFAAGMTPLKIHGQRDSNGKSSRSPASLTTTVIIPKDTFNIVSSLPKFSKYDNERGEMYQKPEFWTLFKATSLTKKDADLTTELVFGVFPLNLDSGDRRSLITNFLVKIWNIDPVLDHLAKREEVRKMDDRELKEYMYRMFDGSFTEGFEMDEDTIWKIFGTFWKFYFRNVIEPICDLDLDRIEFMAVIWILCFDNAYINLSESTSETCRTIRKVIIKELRNYEMEKDPEDSEERFLIIMEIPLMIERAEQHFQDEIMLYEMLKLRMHDDFRTIIRRQRI